MYTETDIVELLDLVDIVDNGGPGSGPRKGGGGGGKGKSPTPVVFHGALSEVSELIDREGLKGSNTAGIQEPVFAATDYGTALEYAISRAGRSDYAVVYHVAESGVPSDRREGYRELGSTVSPDKLVKKDVIDLYKMYKANQLKGDKRKLTREDIEHALVDNSNMTYTVVFIDIPKTVLNGGPGSGPLKGQGRKKSGGGGGKSGGTANVSTTLANSSYTNFEAAPDKPKFLQEHLTDFSVALGMKTKVDILSDQEFNSNIAKDAKAFGVHPSTIEAAYTPGLDRATFRASKVVGIESENDLRLFLNRGYHELGHAYDAKVLGTTFKGYSSQQDYHQGRAEDFANTFAARALLARKKELGAKLIPKELKTTSSEQFIKDTTKIVFTTTTNAGQGWRTMYGGAKVHIGADGSVRGGGPNGLVVRGGSGGKSNDKEPETKKVTTTSGKEQLKEAGFNNLLDDSVKEFENRMAPALLKLKEEYPGIEKELGSIQFGELGSDVPFTVRYDGLDKPVLLVSRGVKKPAKLEREIASAHKDGWLATGTFEGLLDHEMAHVIDKASTSSSNRKMNTTSYRGNVYIKQNPPTAKDLSGYGSDKSDPHYKQEAFAEAFAASRHNKKPTAWQQGFNKALTEDVKSIPVASTPSSKKTSTPLPTSRLDSSQIKTKYGSQAARIYEQFQQAKGKKDKKAAARQAKFFEKVTGQKLD